MESLRKWFYKPKKDDKSLLARFFYADEDLNMIASELDSFDGRKDPERCTTLVNQLRQCQDKVLTITNSIMDDLIGDERANRDFRVKFPEDVLQENLAGQLWFGAECLAAGSSIMNREAESIEMRPLAKALTKSLENVRNLLREACLRNNTPNRPLKLNNNEFITEMLVESLKIFDRLFAEFELRYVSAMVPVKSTHEYELQEMIGVLFSETLQRALKMNLLTQDMVDDCDPALMFTIPRLAIVSGLLVFPKGPLCIDRPMEEMSEMFRPFRTLLHKIRDLLWTLNKKELYMLEKLLCDNEQFCDLKSVSELDVNNDLDDFVNRFYNDYPSCKDIVSNFYTVSVNSHNMTTNDFELVDEAKESAPNMIKEERHTSDNIEIPSTSGYLISNTVDHDTIIASLAEMPQQHTHVESLPDNDSLEVISEAAATLSSILTIKDNNNLSSSSSSHLPNNNNNNINNHNLESPNDSGICTENTSLDRSPTIDLIDNNKNCNCPKVLLCKCMKKGNREEMNSSRGDDYLPSTSKLSRKRVKIIKERDKTTSEEDTSSLDSTDTSSFDSNCVDDQEIALALQAAEIACRNEVRSKFRSSEDLIHRLYVCIAGVADQLQTNFASDLRNILKSVFLMNASDTSNDTNVVNSTEVVNQSIEYHPTENEIIENNEFTVDPNILAQEALFDSNVYFQISEENNASSTTSNNHDTRLNDVTLANNDVNTAREIHQQHNQNNHHTNHVEEPPIWIPDIEAPKCMSCGANFTVVKRRHHCRNCGKVFCARCSSNSVPLPKYGHYKAVRVCNKCFLYHLAPFTM